MAQLALGIAGAAVGGAFFGPIGASIGWSLGAAIGSTFAPNEQVYGPRIENLRLSGSSYGAFITRGWGTFRTGCNIIDQTDLVETEHTSGGGKGGGGGVETHTFTYSASCDAAICEGPVVEVRKVWANGRLIFDTTQGSTVDNSGVPVTFYLGTETQEADPTFEAEHGAGNVPAYRGICHAVFADWELGPYGNTLPQLNFEIANETRLPGVDQVLYRNELPFTWGGRASSPTTTFRYGPRIISWPLSGQIHIQQHGVYGGDVYLDAVTLDVVSAHLSATEDSVTADWTNGGAPEYNYHYCGTLADGTKLWIGNTQNGFNFIVHDRSLYVGADQSKNPAISSVKPHMSGADVQGSTDVAYQWGIPTGECPMDLAISADGRMAFVITISTPTTTGSGLDTWASGGTRDRWYKIVDGVLVAQGTISGSVHSFRGNQSHPKIGNLTGAASFENNYEWMWAVSAADIVVYAYRIDGDVFSADEETRIPTLELWGTATGWYPIDGNGVARYGIPVAADDAAPTEEAPASWGFPGGGTPAISIMASSSDGYAGVAVYSRATTIRRFRAVEDYTTLDVIVGDLCEIAGLSNAESENAQYDVTDLEGIVVRGFVLTSQMSARAAIESLMPLYFFDAVESDGVVKFVLRGGDSVATISDDDLAAHTDGEEIPATLSAVRVQEQDLPATMSLVYISADADYQQGSQTSRRMIGGSIEVVTVQAPVVLDATEAKQRADALLYAAWYERDMYQWQTTRKYIYLEPTDVVTVGGKVLRITRKTERADGVVQWEGVPSFGPVFTQTGGGGDGGSGFTPQTPPEAQATDLVLLDIPLVDPDRGPSVPVFYAAMAGASRRSWLGASLQRSIDGGVNYSEALADREPETIGAATTALGDWSGGNIFDETNSVTVLLELGAGTLESATLAAVHLGANEAVLGDEIIKFRTATLTAERTYVLTGLLRGRRGTEWAMGDHAVGDQFVLLPPNWGGIAATFADFNAVRMFKPVTFGNTVAATTSQAFTYHGNVLLPYAPVYPMQTQNGDGDWLLSWTRRTRYGGEWRDHVDAPLFEPSEEYLVTIYSDSTYTTAVREITAATTSATYTIAQQIEDFGSSGEDEIFWGVAQVGAIGPGYDTLGKAPRASAVVGDEEPSIPTNVAGFGRVVVMDLTFPGSGFTDYRTVDGDGYRAGFADGFNPTDLLVVVFSVPPGEEIVQLNVVQELTPVQRRFVLSTVPGDIRLPISGSALWGGISPGTSIELGTTGSSATFLVEANRTYYLNIAYRDLDGTQSDIIVTASNTI